MTGIEKERLVAAHRQNWMGALTLIGLLLPGFAALGVLTFFDLPLWWTAVLIGLVAYLMHTSLIAFHEAAHGSLCPHAGCNDALGILIGFFGFMSLSLYRASHRTHHLYLADERDEELWPFVLPTMPRWLRRLAALAELSLGLVYTPLLFLRSFLRRDSVIRDPLVRRRIWLELALLAVGWTSILTVVAVFDLWPLLLITYVLPALLAGNVQSLRKYIEHMGMMGTTPRGLTRSIHGPGWRRRLVSLTLLNEPYHGIHHQFPRLPQHALPQFADLLTPRRADEPEPFPSYAAATRDLLRCLDDPRIGSQWLAPLPSKPGAAPEQRPGLTPDTALAGSRGSE